MKKVVVSLVVSLPMWVSLVVTPGCRHGIPFSGDFHTWIVHPELPLNKPTTAYLQKLGTGEFVEGEEVLIGEDASEVYFAFTILVTEGDDGESISPVYQTVIIDEQNFALIQTDAKKISPETTILLTPGSYNIVLLFDLHVEGNEIIATPAAYSQSGSVTYHEAGQQINDEMDADFSGFLKEIPAEENDAQGRGPLYRNSLSRAVMGKVANLDTLLNVVTQARGLIAERAAPQEERVPQD